MGWGSSKQPERSGRVLDDGTSQISETTYNQHGHVMERSIRWAPRIVHVCRKRYRSPRIRQTTGAINNLLLTYSNYTATHVPQTITDAAGQSTTITYSAAGQILTVTNAKGETSTNVFDANGFLQSVTRPVTGATTIYPYNSIGRTRTVTDSDGYVVTLDYDALDRPTRTTYPDSTYDEIVYDRLDRGATPRPAGSLGITRYDAMRRVTATTDPAGRTIHQIWCACGSLDTLIDAKGQKTSWQRDVQGRVTSEVRADGTTATIYAYRPRRDG